MNSVKQGHENRLTQIQQQLNTLRERENEVNQVFKKEKKHFLKFFTQKCIFLGKSRNLSATATVGRAKIDNNMFEM